ncbi:envelope glycoprotein [Murid herpesvirus 3]|uniref:Envelope glycoprotein n=2 Tax=Murid betaherpesvirus 3 TaxID=2560603 RepID=A0A1P8VIT3_9BETA|nr:envelope glycoprotein [Murine roseolovirus]APZ76245.1 envelope glycoprotein [Murid betaherpesvirus 3]AYH64783.1 envelope glycoprotein [Murid herpesvirus 3]
MTNSKNFNTLNFPNVTTKDEKNILAKIFITYYFRGILIKAILSRTNKTHLISKFECWSDEYEKGGNIQIISGKDNFSFFTNDNLNRWKGPKNNEILALVNIDYNLDEIFLKYYCPDLADELQRRKLTENEYLKIIKNVPINRKKVSKSWITSWLGWYKYKEYYVFKVTQVDETISFNDYDESIEDTESMNTAGTFFLLIGSLVLLGLFVTLIIMRRRDVSKAMHSDLV